ncbi:MAG: hypothetical protein AAF939_03745 [Planctomycetota bacterium]
MLALRVLSKNVQFSVLAYIESSRIKNPCKSRVCGRVVCDFAGDWPEVDTKVSLHLFSTLKPKDILMDIIAIDLGKFNSMFCFYDTVTNEYLTALLRPIGATSSQSAKISSRIWWSSKLAA